jgi:hypothetical protein
MSSLQSGLEALILGIPVAGLLVSVFFRLDHFLARPTANSGIGHPLSHLGEDGNFVFIEPDGRYSLSEGTVQGLALRRPGHLPRRSGIKLVRRVSVEWVEDDVLA